MITEALVKKLADFNRDEYGCYNEELARLELEDAERKGCLVQYIPYCQNCPHQALNTCPLNDWQKRHPEFVNDELSQKIEALSKEKVYY
jgi:predicted xylose isomerase-like sugar epimerase